MFHGTETWYDYIPLVEEDSSIKLKMEMASSVYWVAFKLITLVIQSPLLNVGKIVVIIGS